MRPRNHSGTHYEIFMSPQLAPTVLPYLNGESGVGTWTGQVGVGD